MKHVYLKDFVSTYPSSTTFEEAIRRNLHSPAACDARVLSKKLAGQTIQRACWNESQFAVLFSGHSGLLFRATLNGLKWEMIDEFSIISSPDLCNRDSEPVCVIRQSSAGKTMENVMDQRAIASNIAGRVFRRVVVDEFGAYLHFEHDSRYLAFHSHIAIGPDRPFLECLEDDD